MLKNSLVIAVAVASIASPLVALAQNFPSRPIRFFVGFAPGGTTDILARGIAQKVNEVGGVTMIVENRPGANTSLATELVAKAPADGHTILLNSQGHATNATLMKLPFDPIKDFAFITLAAETQNLLVTHPSFPPKTVRELIAFSKKRPNEINYASSGVGTTVHLAGELFQLMTDTKWTHVPYKGGAPAMTEMLSGQTSLMFGSMLTVIEHARAGKLRAIAVTGEKRIPSAPEIPTIAESGVPGYNVTAWYGVSAPAKTPPAAIEWLNREIVRSLKSPDLGPRLVSQGVDPVGNTPAQYTAFVQNEVQKWAQVIKAAKIKSE